MMRRRKGSGGTMESFKDVFVFLLVFGLNITIKDGFNLITAIS